MNDQKISVNNKYKKRAADIGQTDILKHQYRFHY